MASLMKPDPSFYPSPRMAMKAAPETLAYVAAFDPNRKVPDAIAVVDVNPKSKTYSSIIGTVKMPNAGNFNAGRCGIRFPVSLRQRPSPLGRRLTDLCPATQIRARQAETDCAGDASV